MAQERQEPQETQELVLTNLATSDVCTQSGPYRSISTPPVIVFVKKGDKFPNAPTSTSSTGQPTTWTLVSGTQTSV
jgi:hypothetical protein